MSIARPYGTIVSGAVSLTNGAPSADIFPAVAGMKYYIYDIIMTTNDAAQPLVTVVDNAAAPVQIFKAYVTSSSPTLVTSQIGTPATVGKKVTCTASAVTAAKTVEIRMTALLSAT